MTANRMFMANGLGTALIADTCTIGQVLEYDGTNWLCKASSTLGPANAYVQNGNAFGAKAVLGTTDNNALEIITNNTAKMTVLANGNVGIGATLPTVALHVSRPSDNSFIMDSTGSSIGYYMLTGAARNMFGTTGTGAAIGTNSNHPFWIGTANSTRMYFDTSGNVGIGTTAPRAPADINGTILTKASTLNATANVNFLLGNIQHTTQSCGTFNLYSMKDGGSYTFVVKGGVSATCVFNAYSSADNSVALTVHMPTDHAATVATTHTIYTFLVVDTDVYVSWIPGM